MTKKISEMEAKATLIKKSNKKVKFNKKYVILNAIFMFGQ